MTTYVIRDGKLVDKRYAAPIVSGDRSDLPCPMLIRDGLDDVVNPCDGKPYSSKRAYYAAVRAAGCEIAGNDPAITRQKDVPEIDSSDDVVQAYRDVVEGYKPAVITSGTGAADSSWL